MKMKDLTFIDPNKWYHLRLKNIVTINNGKDYKDYETSEGIPVIGSGGPFAYVSKCMYDGEVILLGRKGTIDRPLYYNGPFWSVDTMFYAIPNKIAFGKFVYYTAILFPFKKYSTATALPSMTQTALYQIPINLPSLDEQKLIVDYLDKKLADIDRRVEVLEKQSDAFLRLKKSVIHQAVTRGLNPDVHLKDSGIDWIGSIPEHWERRRIKDIGYLYGGLTGKSGDDFRCEDESITKPYVPFTNVLKNTVVDINNFHRVVMTEDEKQNLVKGGDIIFLMSSEDYDSIAKTAVVIGDLGEVYLNSFCKGLRVTNKNCYSPFINYQLNSEQYRDALRFEARGFTRINIKIDRISSHFVTMPPVSEQLSIVSYLDEKCSKIDAAIENIGKQIDASKRLKKAIINEAISGKINYDNN